MIVEARQQIRHTLVRTSLPMRRHWNRLPKPQAENIQSHRSAMWTGHEAGSYAGEVAPFSPNSSHVRDFDIDTVVLSSLENATLRNNHAFTDRRELLYEENLDFEVLPVSLQLLESPRSHYPRVAYLSNTWPTNFYHWLCLTLPLLRYYEAAGVEVDRVYVGNELKPWQRRSLDLAGVPGNRVVVGPCTADEIDVVVSTRRTGAIAPASVSWLRETLGVRASASGTQRLFVGRGKTTTRRMLNEEAVAAALERNFGFSYVLTSDMSLDEEIELFGNASAVVAPYGAALTNLLFAPSSTRVLELRARDAAFPARSAFLELGRIIGQTYGVLVGEAVPEPKRAISSDIKIDVDALLRVVERMLPGG